MPPRLNPRELRKAHEAAIAVAVVFTVLAGAIFTLTAVSPVMRPERVGYGLAMTGSALCVWYIAYRISRVYEDRPRRGTPRQ